MVRPRDLTALRIARTPLTRLVDQGRLERVGRGVYRLADAEISADHSLAQAAKRVPEGVVCLLSALRFHGMTTEAPFEVWLAVDRKARRPRLDYPPLRIVRFSGKALTEGVESHVVDGVEVRVYAAAKTVADCFKYRNKIGTDVAIAALRDLREQRRGSADELWHYAQICRVATVMRPYLEAVQ